MKKESIIYKLKTITTKRDKLLLLILLIFSIFLSIIESIGISAIMPFITLATNPELIQMNSYSKFIFELFNFSSLNEFMIIFGIVLIFFYIFRGLYSIFYTYFLNRFSFGRFHVFAFRLFKNYTYLPYNKFVKQNRADMVKNIVNEAANLSSLIQNALNMVSEFFTIVLLYTLLLFVNWKMTLLLTIFLGIKIFFLIFGLKKTIKRQGEKRSKMQSKFYRILNDTFGNFKMIKLIQNEEKLFIEFSKASYGYARTNIINNTLSQFPRISLESIGFIVIISIVLYILISHNNPTLVLPIISMYALALYRILPAINRILSSYNQIIFLNSSLDIIHKELKYIPPKEGIEPIEFKQKIELTNINFEYINGKRVLENINLTIYKGEKIAFIGESGSGKSTLVDLIIGLYKPLTGTITIDNIMLNSQNIRSYRSKVGYIPQSIYLFDGTVAENVSFGYEYNEEKIVSSLKKANIYEFLIKKEGINTYVGDGGVQLSGGQKQRIGIARALYSDPEILVLDEATSALDNETEAIIMKEIYELSRDKTLLIIAHRLSTLVKCDRKIILNKGKVI
ncbi:ABC transporter ATP-binding protein [Aliarcobacter cryaerophilus]|uniref:ABC transporter ATP-binding protein n=1 Tax=Aliarcobacter cryaerophilus TaxID=28198 RepID=UPI0011DF49DB|nr:ABC transporter ATP-binding protein [Aliarcobacter cryaerophilus]